MQKKLMTLTLGLVLSSFNVNALEVVSGIYGLATGSMLSWGAITSIKGVDCAVGQGPCKEAVQVINDIQNYHQSGVLSVFLAQKMAEIKNVDASLSEAEALDELTSNALDVISL